MKKLMLSCFALCAFAAFGETVTIDVSGLSGSVSKDGYAYDANAHLLTLREDRQFVLTGSSSDVRVYVTENVKSVTLNGLKLEHANGKGAPISLEDKSATDVVFALTNANVLVAPPQCAAIEVPRNATLTISADDDAAELNAVGGGAGKGDNDEPSDEYGDDPENGGEGGGAGIGMGWNADCGTIVILGGKVTAAGGNKAAGIGGGAAGGCAGNVEIFGGTILSAGGWGAAGIGSGYEQGNDQEFTPSHNGKIVISGGRVTAKGGDGGAGIGGGGYWRRAKYRPKGPDVEISGGTVSAKGGKAVRYKGWKTSYSPWDFGAGSNPDDEKLPKVVVRGGTVYATNADDSWHFNKEPCQSAEDEWPVGGVYPVYVRLGSSVADAKVEVVGLPQDYDVKDLYANEAGDLCFYLPAGKRVTFAVWWRDVDGTVVSKQFWAAPCEWRTEAQPLTVDGLLVNGVAVNNFTSGPGWVRDDYDRDRYIIRLNGSVERYVLTGMASNAVVSVENLNSTKVLELKDLCLEYGGILRWSMISFGNACRGKQVRLELNGVSFLQGHVNAISLCDGLFCEIDAAAGATNAVLIAAAGEVVNQVQTAATGAICGRGETLSEPMGTVALRGGCLYLEGGGADWGSNPIHSCAGLYAKTNIVSGGTLRVLAGKRGLGQNPPQPSMRASEANIFAGGSVLAGDGKMSTEVAIRVAPTNGAGKAVHRVTVPVSGGTGDDRRVKISGIPDYGCKDIVALNGKAYLYLPDGDYVFTVNGKFVRATVNGADTEATDELGFTVNGTDVLAGPGEGWSYNGDDGTLMIFGAGTYVLSGGAMFDEVQVNVAGPQNPTVVLSNAVIFTEVRPALNVATGATLALAAGQVMMAGDAPETMRYAADWAAKTSILAGPGATVTVKDGIPHVTATVVSNRTGTVSGAATEGGRAYRVLLGDDIFVGYTVEKGYFPRAENPLRYPAVGGDVTVDAKTIPVAADLPYRAWNPTTRQMEDRVCSGYEVVTTETTTFENGKWYAVTNTVQRGMITVRGAAHLILCDDARLTLTGSLAVPGNSAISIHGQTLGTGELNTQGNRWGSGIGGHSWNKSGSGACGAVTIDGGRVWARGGKWAAGIGGHKGAGGTVTINGGQVSAQGGQSGAGIGGGHKGGGGTVTINGGTVMAAGGSTGIGRGMRSWGDFKLTIDGGSVKASMVKNLAKNSTPTNVYCVTAKCPSFAKATEGKPLGLEGLEGYGTNDIYPVKNDFGEDCVYLRLPNGTYRFTLSDGSTTHRYFAVVKGIDITVEPLPPSIAVGFFVNGEDIGARAGTGWTYGGDKVLSLNGNGTYVLSGLATNDEVQVRVAQQGATVVLSNAVVFTEGRPALDVAQGAALQMAGGASFLGTTNDAAAVSVAQGAALAVGLAPGANRLETMIGVFNYDAVAAVAGQGSAKVNGGTFFVWADGQAVGTPVNFTYGMGELMQTGKTPEAMMYAETCSTNPCVLVGPAVTVMVRDIPHVTDVVVSNRIEAIAHATTVGGTVYRVMLGDDVFVGYALEEDYVTDAENPLVYASIGNDVTVDETVIPAVRAIPFRDWNAETRQMEDWICADYTVVTADTATFEDDQWYVVTNTVSRGTITVSGAAHLILCDGAKLAVTGGANGAGLAVTNGNALTIYGQSLGSGELVAKGDGAAAGIGSNSGAKGGAVTLNGGLVTATGGKYAAGIGGGNAGDGGVITINGGTVTAAGDRMLPVGYTEVEYIESTPDGGQYVNTGYTPNKDTKIVCRLLDRGTDSHRQFGAAFGTREGYSWKRCLHLWLRHCNENRPSYGRAGAESWSEKSTFPFGEITTVTCQGPTCSWVNDAGTKENGITLTTDYDVNQEKCLAPLTIFAINSTTAEGGCTPLEFWGFRLYSFQIYEGATLVHDFVPCVEGATGKAGLYDIVGRRFHGNDGNGQFAHSEVTIADAADIGGGRTGADATVTFNGGSVKAATVRSAPTNGTGAPVYCVKTKCTGLEGLVSLEGLEGYGTDGIRPVDGWVYLWLPNGTHRFALSGGQTTNRYCAVVDGKGVTVEPLGPIGFFADGVDIGVDGIGDGWHYQERVLTLGGAKAYVLSGEATNDEVQVNVAANGATAVLSNAFVFASGRPAVEIAQGAALAIGAGQVMLAGESPETLRYATTCGVARCVRVVPGATVTVKDITHVSDVVVSNLTGTVPGVPVTGGTAYRVMLGDSIFVGYTVEEGYVSPAENPLVYMAFEGDFTVDGDTIPVLPDVVSYIGRWNGTNETVVVTGNYVVVDANLTTLAGGVTYVVKGTVTNRNLLSLSGPATLVVCDGAMLVAEGGFASAGWPAVTNALSIHGQAAGDGLLFAKDFQGVDTAIHGITTVTDGIFGGTPAFLGGTVSANTVSNGQLMAVMGGNVCIGTRFAFSCDGGERPVYAVTCPVPGVAGRMTIEGLAGYCTEDIFPVDGVICLYLPKGEHVFTVNGVRMRALVIGDGTVAERDDGGYLAYGRGGELLGAFARLTNAVHAAANGGMVKLTNDCHEAGAFVLPEGAALTLDGCGYRLTLDATDFSAPSALISTNAALCLTNIVLTRSAVSRNTGLLAVADGGAVEMRNCTVENCDAFVSPLISVANGGFRAADVRFFGNTASVLVEAAVRSADARFEIAKWFASGNVCDELFKVDNLSGRVDACEIGAGEQSWNGCGVADLSVGVGAACLRGAPPLPKVRLAGFAMGEDALHSHLVYRDAPPQGGVVLDVSSPDARIGSVIVSNAFDVAVAPQDVTLMTPGCRVIADAGGNLRLELASARPYIVRTITGAQTNYVPYATMEEAIAHGGRDILLMSYEESGSRQSVLAGNVSVPVGERFSLDTVRLTVTTNENWTAPSPDPVTLEGTITVPTNTVLRLGNVLPREIDLGREAYVLVEARPPERRYLYFRFSQDALDHILADGVVVASTCLSSAALKDVCAVLNEGYALVPVPADEVPAGLSGALWLTPTKYHEAWIVGEDAPRPSFIGAMESANDAVGHVDVTMRALSYTNETDGTVIGGYSSMGRGITVGGTNGNVRLTVGSWRIRVKGEERTVMNPPFPLTKLNLDGSKLNIRKDSVLALADIDVVGAFTLVGEGVLNLSGYQGSKLSVFIDPAADGKPRRIAEAGATGKIQLAAGQKGELFVNEEGVWWQLGVTCEYKQIANGKVRVTIRKNGEFKDEKDVMVTTGRATYTYDDGGVPRTFTLMAVYVDWANDDGPKMFAPRGASYETIGGAFASFGDAIENGMPMPKDIRLIKNNGLKVRCKFPAGDFEADLLTDDPGPDQAPLDLSILSDDELEKMGIPDEDFDDPEIRDFVLGVIAVNAAIVAAGASGTIAYQTFKKWWKRFCNAITVIDLIRCIRNLITDAVRFKKYPLLYKEKWYPANQFTNLCARCAKDNGSGDKGNSILLRHAFSVDPLELGSVGFVKMDAEFSVWGDELARLLIDYTNKLDAVRDVVGLVVAILDLMISDEFDKWGLLAFGVEKVAMIIEMACFLSYRYEYPLPPLGGSLALSSGVKYDFVKMKFDALRKSRYLRAMGDNSPAGTVRTAPILVAKPGSTSEFDTCELRNFQYSSPSGLIYACSGATLVFKDFIVVSNKCTAVEKRPPIVVEKGATVWVCGNSAIEGIEAVGADLRIGYGPHGDDAPKASELTGKGTINVFGETGYGKEIGTATFPSATSNALNRIISRQYSNWVESVVSDVGGALKTVWKEKDGARQKLAPIKFKQGNPFSVSVIRSGTGNKATVTGGLEVPTKEAIDELPLEFSIDFTDSLKDGKVAETNVTVNPTTHDFKQEFDGLGNSQFFRLKYRNRLEGSK